MTQTHITDFSNLRTACIRLLHMSTLSDIVQTPNFNCDSMNAPYDHRCPELHCAQVLACETRMLPGARRQLLSSLIIPQRRHAPRNKVTTRSPDTSPYACQPQYEACSKDPTQPVVVAAKIAPHSTRTKNPDFPLASCSQVA